MASQLDQTLQPTVSMMGHLRRMRDGSIWASYRLTGLPYGYTSPERKKTVLTHHKNLFRSLPNHSVIAGVVARMNPDEIVARSLGIADVNRYPRWRDECEGKHAYFSTDKKPTERIITVSFPVSDSDAVTDVAAWSGARRSRERDRTEMRKAFTHADAIVAQLPGVFEPVALTAAQMVWLWNRAISRGGAPEVFPAAVASNVSSPAGAFAMAEFDEGERRPEVKRWKPSSFAPLLKVSQPGRLGAQMSWQTLLAVESLPLDGLQFPGSEFFTIADRVSIERTIDGQKVHFPIDDIDWAVRISRTSRDVAIARNTKNLRRLSEQVVERDTEVSFAQDTLAEQVQLLGEYNALLEQRDDEVEVSLCPIFVVSGANRAQCEERALALTREFEANRIKVVAPLGGQRELWAAMNPGGSTHRVVSDYAHNTISEYAASCVPCAADSVGDARGPVIALNLSGRRNQPVYFEWWREALKDRSPSVAIAGELGAGKTWLIMTMLYHLVDIGGQFLAIDRTDSGEYARPAALLPTAQIVDLMDPTATLDPLRTFPAHLGVDSAVELLTPLFDCEANDAMGMALSELLRPEWGVRSIPELLQALEVGIASGRTPDDKPLPLGWEALHRHLSYWQNRRYARALFDPNLPPLDLKAEGIVIRTNRVEVPTAEEIAGGEKLGPSKIFGRAIYGLALELGRQAFQLDKPRPAAVAMDEAYHVTSSPTGLSRVTRVVRDGRKDNIAMLLGSHDPLNDYPPQTALDLISMKIVMRHRTETLAQRSLKWLGIDPETNPHIVRDLTERTSPAGPDGKTIKGREGEGYMRDASGGIGRIKVLGPSDPARQAAMRTTPIDHAEITGRDFAVA